MTLVCTDLQLRNLFTDVFYVTSQIILNIVYMHIIL